MTRDEALPVVRAALAHAVPGADAGLLADETVIREELEMDSLDFLGFVETLAERTGCRIDEDDYAALTTVGDAAAFIAERTG